MASVVPPGSTAASAKPPAAEATRAHAEAMRTAHAMIEAITAGTSDGILAFDLQRRFTLWNPAMAQLYGVPAEQVLGRTLDECFPELARTWLLDAYEWALRGETMTLHAREITSGTTGHTSVVDATYRPMLDHQGRCIGGVGTLRDRTRERQTAQRMVRLSAIADRMSEGVVMTDAAGRIVWVNDAWQRMTGWTLAEVQGHSPGAVLRGPQSSAESRVAMRRAIAAGEPYSASLVNHRRDGAPIWMQVQITPMRDDDGSLTGWVGIQHDITEMRWREQSLKAERAFAASLVAANADGIVALDRELHVTEWNAVMERWSGIPRATALGMHLDDVIPLPQAPQRRLRFQRLLEDGESFFQARDYSFPWSDLVWHVETISTAIRDLETGEITGVLSTIREISERLAAEQALRREQRRLLDAIGAMESGMAMFDADERLVAFNPAFAAMQPPRVPPAVGMTLTELLSPVVRDGNHSITGEPGDAWLARMLARHRTGGVFEEVVGSFIMRGSISHTQDGGSVVLLTDITALKEIQTSMEQARDAANAANRIKSEFLARMSHELRTPLNSIIGFSRQLLRRPASSFEGRDRHYLERVQENGTHLLSLINSILDLSKIEAGRMDVLTTPTDLESLVRETVSLLEGQPRAEGVELRTDVPIGLRPALIDGAKLRQVIINLVGNALKFTRAGTVLVRVEADAESRPARIAVVDTGVGIPAQRMEAIFEAFEQVDVSTARTFGGTGLGLSISRALCHALGARLEARSVEGSGSTFTIVLPPAG